MQSRVGHPTLGPGPGSAGIIKGIAGDFRPPHCKEGFHTVLRCKDDQDLSDAVALFSYWCCHGHGRPEASRASGAPAIVESGARGVGGRRGGVEKSSTVSDQPPVNGSAVLPRGHDWPEGVTAVAGTPPTRHPSELVPRDRSGLATGMGMGISEAAAAAAGQSFPVGTEYYVGEASQAFTPQTVGRTGPISAWGQGQQVAVDGMRSAVNSVRPAGTDDADNYPPLPLGSSVGNGNKSQRITSITSKQPPQPLLPTSYQSSSLNSIAKLTPQAQAVASAAVKQPATPETRLLTPAEISANFSDLEAPPRVIAPEDVGVAAPARNDRSKSRPGATTMKQDDAAASTNLPLGPSTLQGWASRSAASTTGEGAKNSDRSEKSVAVAGGLAHDICEGNAAAAAGGDCGSVEPAVARKNQEGLDLSVGEAFFVLEDMFGGLLPPETLEKVFLESTNDLEKVGER